MPSEDKIRILALGGNPDLKHEGIIGKGGFAYVHQVFPHLTIAYRDIDLQHCD